MSSAVDQSPVVPGGRMRGGGTFPLAMARLLSHLTLLSTANPANPANLTSPSSSSQSSHVNLGSQRKRDRAAEEDDGVAPMWLSKDGARVCIPDETDLERMGKAFELVAEYGVYRGDPRRALVNTSRVTRDDFAEHIRSGLASLKRQLQQYGFSYDRGFGWSHRTIPVLRTGTSAHEIAQMAARIGAERGRKRASGAPRSARLSDASSAGPAAATASSSANPATGISANPHLQHQIHVQQQQQQHGVLSANPQAQVETMFAKREDLPVVAPSVVGPLDRTADFVEHLASACASGSDPTLTRRIASYPLPGYEMKWKSCFEDLVGGARSYLELVNARVQMQAAQLASQFQQFQQHQMHQMQMHMHMQQQQQQGTVLPSLTQMQSAFPTDPYNQLARQQSFARSLTGQSGDGMGGVLPGFSSIGDDSARAFSSASAMGLGILPAHQAMTMQQNTMNRGAFDPSIPSSPPPDLSSQISNVSNLFGSQNGTTGDDPAKHRSRSASPASNVDDEAPPAKRPKGDALSILANATDA